MFHLKKINRTCQVLNSSTDNAGEKGEYKKGASISLQAVDESFLSCRTQTVTLQVAGAQSKSSPAFDGCGDSPMGNLWRQNAFLPISCLSQGQIAQVPGKLSFQRCFVWISTSCLEIKMGEVGERVDFC